MDAGPAAGASSLSTWATALSLLLAIGTVPHATGPAGATPAASAFGAIPERQGGAGSPRVPAQQRGIDPQGYTSARVCGECHADIYESWKNSLHAFSLTDPIFDTAYMQALKHAGEEARRFCLRCHAPMTMFNGDYELVLGVTREGVSCDFCHTVTAVHLDGRTPPYEVEPGLVKRSILRRAASPAHAVAYSELHATSEFCGGCHNLLAANGTAIMGTYDEWRTGPYAAEGIQCQHCHMVRGPGRVVVPSVKESGTRIHLHSLIHDTEQLRGALSVEITGSERRGGGVDVEVLVENVGSGHMVPTGMPTREIVLAVTAEAAGRTRSAERRYRKVIADERGVPLHTDFEVLLNGARILNDTRIAPREKRLERFRFEMPSSGPLKVTASLSYHYAPPILHVQRVDVRLGTAERVIH